MELIEGLSLYEVKFSNTTQTPTLIAAESFGAAARVAFDWSRHEPFSITYAGSDLVVKTPSGIGPGRIVKL